MNIGIIDYGMGNLFSVAEAIKRLGCDYFIAGDSTTLAQADALILPGVGAFPDAMHKLKASKLDMFIAQQTKPVLGICLGMQLLFEFSEEVQPTSGLGVINGQITKFDASALRVPHIGWSELTWHKPYVESTTDFVYFVHSFYATQTNEADIVASAQYGDVQVPAVVQYANFTGMQFHPEKSGELGKQLLKRWLKDVAK
ncbi:imidazole glycerol phosphate synthase subunit HisH [Metalysinibacillus jejuensis]|uniref:imidazole glycerol phosphate synthase subunit HisH n=1 Tax=Metalysinibacillus jejuensis TaxID=914327 RepID=UPI000D3CA67F|nr:imidazole glycerol phosphate synthase subunit HisH [Metalysinibacillus jejuensis]